MIAALERVKEDLTPILSSKRRDARVERSRMMSTLSPRGSPTHNESIGAWSFASSTCGPWSLKGGPEKMQRTAPVQGPNDQMDEEKTLARADHLEKIARKYVWLERQRSSKERRLAGKLLL